MECGLGGVRGCGGMDWVHGWSQGVRGHGLGAWVGSGACGGMKTIKSGANCFRSPEADKQLKPDLIALHNQAYTCKN